jgi:hypothetical protein
MPRVPAPRADSKAWRGPSRSRALAAPFPLAEVAARHAKLLVEAPLLEVLEVAGAGTGHPGEQGREIRQLERVLARRRREPQAEAGIRHELGCELRARGGRVLQPVALVEDDHVELGGGAGARKPLLRPDLLAGGVADLE